MTISNYGNITNLHTTKLYSVSGVNLRMGKLRSLPEYMILSFMITSYLLRRPSGTSGGPHDTTNSLRPITFTWGLDGA